MSGAGPEIERSWILKNPIDTTLVEQHTYHEIGYVFTAPGELRVVYKKDFPSPTYWITVKSDGDLVRDEWEVRIPQWVYRSLWSKTGAEGTNAQVFKTRYYIMYGKYCLEIDEYFGDLEGLWRLECEFADEQEALSFKLPQWVGQYKEVTNDKRFKNKNLALNGLPEGWNDFSS